LVILLIVHFLNFVLFGDFGLKVHDLQYASPATISRCGMVYVDPKNLGYEPFWNKWVEDRPIMLEVEELKRLYKRYVPSCIDMICYGIIDGKQGEKLKTIVPLTSLNMVYIYI